MCRFFIFLSLTMGAWVFNPLTNPLTRNRLDVEDVDLSVDSEIDNFDPLAPEFEMEPETPDEIFENQRL